MSPRAAAPKKKTSQRRKDWKKARELYELEGKTFSEIAESLPCDPHTVSRHAKREGWVSHQRVLSESAPTRLEKMIEGFVEQESVAIRENLRLKHALNRRILLLAQRHVERLEEGKEFTIKLGERRDGTPILLEEDPVLSLRRLALVAQSVEMMDRSIGNLKDGAWRTAQTDPDESSALTPAQIEALLSATAPVPAAGSPGVN